MILPVGVLGVGRHVWVLLPLVEGAVHLRGSVPLDFVVVGCLPLDEPATAGRRRKRERQYVRSQVSFVTNGSA